MLLPPFREQWDIYYVTYAGVLGTTNQLQKYNNFRNHQEEIESILLQYGL